MIKIEATAVILAETLLPSATVPAGGKVSTSSTYEPQAAMSIASPTVFNFAL
jgi:hypothetical protein